MGTKILATAVAGVVLSVFVAVARHPGGFAPPAGESQPAAVPALLEARQLVLVVTSNWNNLFGRLRKFERISTDSPWRSVGLPVSVVVGRNGLAWGIGLHGDPPGSGPVKREGDGCSPAGIFGLSAAFGYGPAPRQLKLPYFQSQAATECVDDPRSAHYNSIVDRSQVPQADWVSSEQMRRLDDLYRLGVVVDHNSGKPMAGAGSCIFLHIWSGPSNGTAGCTAMETRKLEELLFWLDPEANPVLVQLPDAEYMRLRGPWRLPL